MRCYYCAETIQDAAIVCRYCGRDLNFAKPFAERISAMEAGLDQVSQRVSLLSEQISALTNPEPHGGEAQKSDFQVAIFPAIVSVVAASLFYAVYKLTGYASPLWFVGSLVTPLPFWFLGWPTIG